MRSFKQDRRGIRRSSWQRLREAVWEEMVRRYGTLLALRICQVLRASGVDPTPEQVEEMVQEAYLRLLTQGERRLEQCRAESEKQVAVYLARVAERVALDELRAAIAVKRGSGLLIPLDSPQGARAAEVADPRDTPEMLAMRREVRRLLLEICRALPGRAARGDRQRNLRILRLALIEGWSSREIARAEGGRLAASTVDTVVHRARRMLLARHGYALPVRR
jgi:RNA polymerase sigma factor (sigma-70 family)